MPDLENLKKQAKLILRWHRERHYPVAAQIRGLIPRFLNMRDSEILAASFKLRDAQEMVARQHGFDSWQALRTGLADTSRKIRKVAQGTIHLYIRRMVGLIVPPFSLSLAALSGVAYGKSG